MDTSEISPQLEEEEVIVNSPNEPGDSSVTIPVGFEYEGIGSISDEAPEDPSYSLMMDPSYLLMMDSMRARVEKSSDTENDWRMFTVPSRLRELNEDAYTPRIVSIGPIHFGKENLQVMEAHKTRYMKLLFQRTTDHDLTFSKCVEVILSIEKIARSYYDGCEIIYSNGRRLAEILLVDGFILELCLRWKFWVNSTKIGDDPLFGASICSLQRNLALLENQIPFFVLQYLFDVIMEYLNQEYQANQIPLNELCASFFYLELNSNQSSSSDCRHLLDLIRNCYLPRQNADIQQVGTEQNTDIQQVGTELKPVKNHRGGKHPNHCCVPITRTKKKPQKKRWELIHCVTKLRESGIKFEKGTSENLFDIKFSSNKLGLGVLEIPKLFIDDTMDSLLRNMIALEQCCHRTSYHITSYAVLMDCLIDSPADAEFLQHRRIIENYLGHGEEVSNIFNKISKKVFVEDFYFDTLCKQVNAYSDKCWHVKREIFVRDYWLSPWKFIGIVAGSMLLLFTAFQTGYTIAAYYVIHT